MKKKTVDRIYMLFYGIVGLVSLILSSSSIGKIYRECKVGLIRDGLTFVVLISSVMLTIAVSYMFCNWRKGDCYSQNKDIDTSETYMYITLFLSLVQVVLLSIILTKLNGACVGDVSGATDKLRKDGKDLKFNVWALLVMNTMILAGSVGGLWYISTH